MLAQTLIGGGRIDGLDGARLLHMHVPFGLFRSHPAGRLR